jgi:hypothetical protein
MKIKLLASSLLMAGALMASSVASAVPIFAGTANAWMAAGVVGDSNMDFTATSGTLTGDLAGTGDFIDVLISQVTTVAEVIYTVNFHFNVFDTNILNPFFGSSGYSGSGGNFEYSMTSLGQNPLITSASFDTLTIGKVGEHATKELFSNSTFTGTPFLTLTSTNGSQDPVAGHTNFPGQQTVYIRDTLFNTGGSIFTDASNEFNVKVPEPTTIAMMGLGLLGFAASRKKKAGLSAMSA